MILIIVSVSNVKLLDVRRGTATFERKKLNATRRQDSTLVKLYVYSYTEPNTRLDASSALAGVAPTLA
eukprot:SAG11_NODE_5921_length_1432_cov_2.393848_2_plen_68_part_00